MWPDFFASGSFLQMPDGKILLGFGPKIAVEGPSASIEEPIWYSNTFFLEETRPFYRHAKWAIIDRFSPSSEVHKFNWTDPASINLSAHFFKVVDKIVLFRSIKAAEKPSKERLLSKVIPRPEGIFFGQWDQNSGFFGFSPERLFEKESELAYSLFAVAGTKKQGEEFTGKEKREHEWVVKGIQEACAPYGMLTLKEEMRHSFGPIDHAISTFSFLKEKSLSDQELIERLHPTPALGGYPKEESIALLKEWDRLYPRKKFGAPFGYFFKGSGRIVIAIRTLFWDQFGSTIFGGAGITRESDFLLEQEEMAMKINATCNFLCE